MQKVFVQFTRDDSGEYTDWRFSGIFAKHPFPDKSERELDEELGIVIEEHEVQEV